MKKDDKEKNGHNYARIEQFYEDDDDETVIHPDSQLSLPLSFHSSEIESNLGKKIFIVIFSLSLLSTAHHCKGWVPDGLLPPILWEY